MTVKQAFHVFYQFISQRQINGLAHYNKIKEVDKQMKLILVVSNPLYVVLLLLLQLGQSNFHKNV